MRVYRYVKVLETIKTSETIENDNHKVDSTVTDINPKFKTTIQESKLFFSHPASFNDPLECTIPITIENYNKNKQKYMEYLKLIMNEILGNQIDESDRRKRIYEAFEYGIPLEKCLMVCFAEGGNNQLMWAHYADQHKGACLCYEFPDTIDEFKRQVKWSEQISFDMSNYELDVKIAKVNYLTRRPSLRISNTSLPIDKWKFDNDYAMNDAIFTKPKCWVYEDEWRLALTLPFESEISFGVGIKKEDFYAKLPREWLKEVTFGLRLEKRYCETIKSIFKNSGYSTIKFKKAKLVHNKFSIVVAPY